MKMHTTFYSQYICPLIKMHRKVHLMSGHFFHARNEVVVFCKQTMREIKWLILSALLMYIKSEVSWVFAPGYYICYCYERDFCFRSVKGIEVVPRDFCAWIWWPDSCSMCIFQVSECVRHEKILEELQKMFAYLQVSLFCLVPLLPEWVVIASSVFLFCWIQNMHVWVFACLFGLRSYG